MIKTRGCSQSALAMTLPLTLVTLIQLYVMACTAYKPYLWSLVQSKITQNGLQVTGMLYYSEVESRARQLLVDVAAVAVPCP